MTGKGVIPIIEKFLQPNYLLALEFAEGFVFGRVVRRRICQYKPYPLVDATGSPVTISPGAYQPELTLRDPRNPANEILYLDSTTNSGYPWILHGSIGIKPAYVYMYPRFPSGKTIPGKFPNLDPIRPPSGDNFGYVSSSESPYEEPTDFVEYVVPPLQRIGFEFYNKDLNKAHQPVLNILFAVYWFQALKPDTHSKLIGRIASRDVPAAFITVGFGDRPIELGAILTKDWDVKPMSLDEAVSLGGGR